MPLYWSIYANDLSVFLVFVWCIKYLQEIHCSVLFVPAKRDAKKTVHLWSHPAVHSCKFECFEVHSNTLSNGNDWRSCDHTMLGGTLLVKLLFITYGYVVKLNHVKMYLKSIMYICQKDKQEVIYRTILFSL